MGLDAKIFCDCFERGRLLNPPRPRWGSWSIENRVDSIAASIEKKVDREISVCLKACGYLEDLDENRPEKERKDKWNR